MCTSGGMDSSELLARAERFALVSLAFYRKLPKGAEAQVPGVQFYKAATSAWSNYRASKRGRSRPEFISKLGIVVEEMDEALGWLEFMERGEIAADERLHREAIELCAIFTASLNTSRRNWALQQAACSSSRRKARSRL
jgi:four helix bundle protein